MLLYALVAFSVSFILLVTSAVVPQHGFRWFLVACFVLIGALALFGSVRGRVTIPPKEEDLNLGLFTADEKFYRRMGVDENGD
jgi:hypothetical protein